MNLARAGRGTAPRSGYRILIVDDHPMIRERLTEVIQQEPDLSVCGEAADRQGALELVEKTDPHLIIVDLTLRKSQGLDLIKDVRVLRPKLPILVLSMHDETLYAERVIRAGARGYINKQEATRKILLAIRTVLGGKLYLSQQMAARLVSRVSSVPRPPIPDAAELTDREMMVLQFIGLGWGTRQIAQDAGLQIPTIETYRARIKEKLGLKDGNELRQYAINWVQTGPDRR